MTTFSVTILGCGSATPTNTRHPAAQVVNHNERLFLIDCGEGTQIQLRKYHFKFQRINHIFISHLHGDHYYGMVGLISTFNLLGRTAPLHIFSPPDLEEIINVLHRYSHVHLNFPLIFHALNFKGKSVVFEDRKLIAEAFFLKHRIECYGFIFREKQGLKNIRKDTIEKYGLGIPDIIRIKNGDDFIGADGIKIPNSELTVPDNPLRCYAYCSDTLYDESLIPYFNDINLLYHDSTFAKDKEDRASETYHTTAAQAATIAKKSGVDKLMLGHFSSRYDDLKPMLSEAKPIFDNTILAEEGLTCRIEPCL